MSPSKYEHKRGPHRKFTDYEIFVIREMSKRKIPRSYMAEKFGVSLATIDQIIACKGAYQYRK